MSQIWLRTRRVKIHDCKFYYRVYVTVMIRREEAKGIV